MESRVRQRHDRRRMLRLAVVVPIVMVLLIGALDSAAAAAAARGAQARFDSADEAVRAFIAAGRADDTSALLRILGPDGRSVISSGDRVSDRQARQRFLAAYDEGSKLANVSEAEVLLKVGKDEWPFPIPIVKDAGGWRFDTGKGKEEILRRRIGQNELSVIQVCLAYVDAQREYAEKDREGDGIIKYAQRIASDSRKRNGLYWDVKPGEEPSPLGPMVARARGEGYGGGKSGAPVPYYGYYYRILTEQGKNAPGGAYGYVVRGKMIGGFALVAYPAQYGSSGVMTFVVNHDGTVYQKDLGPNTAAIARKMTLYNPDQSWKPAR